MSEVIIALLYTFFSPLQVHRKHAEYLNKKIDFYDQLAIVVGKDTAADRKSTRLNSSHSSPSRMPSSA